jgi:hypothetical protein
MLATATVGLAASEIVPPRVRRRFLMIQAAATNTVSVFLKFDSSATEVTTALGLELIPLDWIILAGDSDKIGNAVRAIAASASQSVTIQEET